LPTTQMTYEPVITIATSKVVMAYGVRSFIIIKKYAIYATDVGRVNKTTRNLIAPVLKHWVLEELLLHR
jgi:hypothetical protein